MMKSRYFRDIHQSSRVQLHQAMASPLVPLSHCLSPLLSACFPGKQTRLPCLQEEQVGTAGLAAKVAVTLSGFPHAAQQEAKPSLGCSVSSTLHQTFFVCHQVIKVADRSAVSGDVVLKVGQLGLSLLARRGLLCPHRPARVAVTP